jgi:nucleotide-binding universal stress UspA family protein
MDELSIQPAVVVGIDGSALALRAALWAVDEAVSRDIPLRLVHILEDENPSRDDVACQPTKAEQSIGCAVKAIEDTGKAVKIETEVIRGRPAAALIRLSRFAEMICVGAVGANHFQHGRIGSTAAALAGCAHCAVAITYGRAPTMRPIGNVILAATDDSPDNGVLLETAAHEAAMRGALLRVITCWQPPRADPIATKRGDLEIEAQLERRLARWRARYPGLRAEAAAVHGHLSDYLATHAAQLQVLIVSARGPGHVREVVGAPGHGALASSDCVVLVVDHQHL